MISTDRKIEICSLLGNRISKILSNGNLSDMVTKAKNRNPWFTEESIYRSLQEISLGLLSESELSDWASNYRLNTLRPIKSVGLVMAGNIPAVGFHDVLSIFMSNHKALLKYSSKDDVIIPFLIDQLYLIDTSIEEYFEKVERLNHFDAVIATGGNNTGRYFEYYFKDKPHIIRKSRSGVALLTGEETEEDLLALGDDIFTYFGLGCRNVSKIYIPKGYNLNRLLEILQTFDKVVLHHKYKNNFDYNIALYLLNKEEFLNNGSIILKQDRCIASRIACLHYEYYDDLTECKNTIELSRDEIQCVVTNYNLKGIETIRFGETQKPGLQNYADGIDTMEFLLAI